MFGVVPAVLDAAGQELQGPCEGYLVIKQPWPGQMRTVYGDHARFETVYFSQFNGYYCTGDGCRRDANGYYWITGRTDDVINVRCLLLRPLTSVAIVMLQIKASDDTSPLTLPFG